MRYRLRTLMIVLAIGPPTAAIGYHFWIRHLEWQAAMNQAPNDIETEFVMPVIEINTDGTAISK